MAILNEDLSNAKRLKKQNGRTDERFFKEEDFASITKKLEGPVALMYLLNLRSLPASNIKLANLMNSSLMNVHCSFLN